MQLHYHWMDKIYYKIIESCSWNVSSIFSSENKLCTSFNLSVSEDHTWVTNRPDIGKKNLLTRRAGAACACRACASLTLGGLKYTVMTSSDSWRWLENTRRAEVPPHAWDSNDAADESERPLHGCRRPRRPN